MKCATAPNPPGMTPRRLIALRLARLAWTQADLARALSEVEDRPVTATALAVRLCRLDASPSPRAVDTLARALSLPKRALLSGEPAAVVTARPIGGLALDSTALRVRVRRELLGLTAAQFAARLATVRAGAGVRATLAAIDAIQAPKLTPTARRGGLSRFDALEDAAGADVAGLLLDAGLALGLGADPSPLLAGAPWETLVASPVPAEELDASPGAGPRCAIEAALARAGAAHDEAARALGLDEAGFARFLVDLGAGRSRHRERRALIRLLSAQPRVDQADCGGDVLDSTG